MEHFQLVASPAAESRSQRARRQVVNVLRARQDDARKVPRLEKDCQPFECRAWSITSGPNLVEVRDPDEGVTLERLLAELVDRFQDDGADDGYWVRRELSITRREKIVATITASRNGKNPS